MPSADPTLDADIVKNIEDHINTDKVVLFMKGTAQFPMCGFSAQAVQAIQLAGREQFHTVNVLENPDIRAGLPKYADWPTFPQLWVDGELVGGCDIVVQLYQEGQLKDMVAS